MGCRELDICEIDGRLFATYSFTANANLGENQTEEDLKIETIKSKALKENEYDSLPDEVLLENDHNNKTLFSPHDPTKQCKRSSIKTVGSQFEEHELNDR